MWCVVLRALCTLPFLGKYILNYRLEVEKHISSYRAGSGNRALATGVLLVVVTIAVIVTVFLQGLRLKVEEG